MHPTIFLLKVSIDPVGPAAFPQFLLYLAILLTLISLFRSIKKWRSERETSDTASIINLPVAGMLVSLILFLLLIDYIGFFFRLNASFIFSFLPFGPKEFLEDFNSIDYFAIGLCFFVFEEPYPLLLSLEAPG